MRREKACNATPLTKAEMLACLPTRTGTRHGTCTVWRHPWRCCLSPERWWFHLERTACSVWEKQHFMKEKENPQRNWSVTWGESTLPATKKDINTKNVHILILEYAFDCSPGAGRIRQSLLCQKQDDLDVFPQSPSRMQKKLFWSQKSCDTRMKCNIQKCTRNFGVLTYS